MFVLDMFDDVYNLKVNKMSLLVLLCLFPSYFWFLLLFLLSGWWVMMMTRVH